MAAPRHICIAAHPQGETVSFPSTSTGLSLGLATLRSHFPRATGLKYMDADNWVAVAVENDTFKFPNDEEQHLYIVVSGESGAIDTARQVLSNRSLPSELTALFNRTTSRPSDIMCANSSTKQAPSSVSFRPSFPSASRKAVRSLFKPAKKTKHYSKTYKVVFIADVDLPVTISRDLVVLEGFATVDSTDSDATIITKLRDILTNCSAHVNYNELKILTYMSKTLSMPVTASGFTWTAENLKANVGQGKLYVMVAGFQDGRSSQETDETSASDKIKTRCLDDSSDDELPDINTADTITTAAKLAGTMKTSDSTSATMTTTSLFAGTTASAGVPSSVTSTTNNHPASPVTTADGLDTGTPDLEVTFHPRHYRPGRLSLRQQRDKCTPCSSNSSKSVIEICDSEDEEMSRAIEASLNDSQSLRKEKNTTSIEQVLKEYRDGAVKKDVRTDVIVFRSRVLESTFRAITRKSFNPNGQLYVKFSGEMGEDYGGPRREFFRLSLKELMNSSLFDGQEGQKYFSHDVTSLDEGKYRLAGRLVALSLAQDGPGLHSLSTTLYDLMTGLDPDMSSASVPEDIQHMITQIKEVDNDTKRDKFLTEYMDWFIDRGFNDIYRMILNEKDRLIQMMMKHYIFYRTLAEISEFTRGLNDVGHLWEVVTRHRELFKPIFCHKPTGLTKDVVDGLCKIEFSEPGSNVRKMEDETIYSWEVVLQDIQDENVPLTLEDLLVFMTGADQIPLCGFDRKIEIMFYDQEDGVTRLPSVSTCGLQMWLPRGVGEPDTLSSFIQTAVKGSQGFHKM